MQSLLDTIEAFIKAHNISERKFGEEALNDHRFIATLKKGRSPSMATYQRVQEFMAMYPRHEPYIPRNVRKAA